MRLGTVAAALFVTCCIANPTAPANAGERACSVKNCFFAGDIRDFEVVDRTTLIVYTGSRRCAFKIELRGALCDMTYAPELVFSDPNELPQGDANRRNQQPGDISFAPGVDDPNLPAQRRGRATLRVCDNDLRLQVSGGAFTDQPFTNPQNPLADGPARRDPRFLNPRSDCQLQSVTSMTDDQVMEIYVAHKLVPPPPPMGSGQIDIGKQPGEGRSPESAKDSKDDAKQD
jgi:hypothetical protein